jgi:hypothetical protein
MHVDDVRSVYLSVCLSTVLTTKSVLSTGLATKREDALTGKGRGGPHHALPPPLAFLK